MIKLGERSLGRLEGVHPDLVRVVKRAAATATRAQDFAVVQGLRTREECCVNWGKGRTTAECVAHDVAAKYARPREAKVTWLANPFGSKHCAQGDGYGHAVDLAPYPIDWEDLARFEALAVLMKEAARHEGAGIAWGGDWRAKDLPHFELARG